jgi:hypothetical protein
VDAFQEYYEQVIVTLQANGWTVMGATIPLIVSQGRLPYTTAAETHRRKLNAVIEKIARVREVPVMELGLKVEHLCDGVHLNERGNRAVAAKFADAILKL